MTEKERSLDKLEEALKIAYREKGEEPLEEGWQNDILPRIRGGKNLPSTDPSANEELFSEKNIFILGSILLSMGIIVWLVFCYLFPVEKPILEALLRILFR